MDTISNIILNDTDFNYILEKDYLTELERSVLSNDLDKIKFLISRGETIYSFNKLCNGYLDRKYKINHTKCIKNICYKTALYYAFFINHNITRYIFNFVNNQIEFSCGCELLNHFFESYNSNSYQFSFKSNFLSEHFKSFNLDNYCDVNIDMLTFECLFKKINLSINSDYLPKLSNIYNTNIKIINLLLNQQAYELYKYYLLNNNDIFNKLNIIYDDSLIDINYYNLNENKNILMLTLINNDDDKIISRLLEKGCDIPNNINNILKDCLNLCHYKSVKLLLRRINNEQLYNPYCLFTEILQNSKIIDEEKIEMMKIIEEKQNVSITNKLLIDILKSTISLKCLTLLVNNNSFSENIDQSVITFCIQIKKSHELDLLLKFGRKLLINGEDLHQIPLFIYLRETKIDDDESLNILNTILRFEPKLDIFNELNESPLIVATKNNRKETVSLLINRGSNPFLRDNHNDNCLHIAIKNNYELLTELLCTYKSQGIYLVNEPTIDMKSCLTLTLECNNPFIYFKYLVSVDGINLNYCDADNKSVIYYIISSNINNDLKINICKILFEKNINIKEILETDKNLLSNCIAGDQYVIIEMLINKLIQQKDILIDDQDIISAIRNNKINNYHLKNIYSPAISYLRQNIFKIKKEKLILNDELVMLRKKMFVYILFMIWFLVLGFIEKYMSKKYYYV